MSNVPPKSGIRVPADDLRQLVVQLFEKAGTSSEDAELMAHLLVLMDLRGVFSHGTRQTPGYTYMMLTGRVNPRPEIRIVNETLTTRVLDGDGGMGHFPCYQGAKWAVATAKKYGTAAVTTRNHHHFGGASKYSLVALEQDCIGLAISSHRILIEPNKPIRNVNGGSPISIAIPAGKQPPLVLDMATGFLPPEDRFFEQMPWAFFKELGLGAVMSALGGSLAGIYLPQFQPPQSKWDSSQGSFIAMFDVQCFMPVDQFKQRMDEWIAAARQMKPFPGETQAELPGGLEWQREQDYGRNGIPISPEHQKGLEDLAVKLGVESCFAKYEHTRFGT